jgi:hypothetical protein
MTRRKVAAAVGIGIVATLLLIGIAAVLSLP